MTLPNRIKRPEARVLAETEFVRFAEAVASLTPEEWAMPTDCTGWDARRRAEDTPNKTSASWLLVAARDLREGGPDPQAPTPKPPRTACGMT